MIVAPLTETLPYRSTVQEQRSAELMKVSMHARFVLHY